MNYLHLKRDLWLEAVRGLDDDAERRASTATERKEEVRVQALVRNEVPPVGGHHLDLELRYVSGGSCV